MGPEVVQRVCDYLTKCKHHKAIKFLFVNYDRIIKAKAGNASMYHCTTLWLTGGMHNSRMHPSPLYHCTTLWLTSRMHKSRMHPSLLYHGTALWLTGGMHYSRMHPSPLYHCTTLWLTGGMHKSRMHPDIGPSYDQCSMRTTCLMWPLPYMTTTVWGQPAL